MTGQYAHNIDAKGRLFIPSKLREELGDVFYVTVGQDGCLSVHSDQSWQELRDKLRDTSYTETKTLRTMSALATRCEPDAQGRILLPQRLRQYARALDALSPSPDVADKTARLLAARLGI